MIQRGDLDRRQVPAHLAGDGLNRGNVHIKTLHGRRRRDRVEFLDRHALAGFLRLDVEIDLDRWQFLHRVRCNRTDIDQIVHENKQADRDRGGDGQDDRRPDR